MLRRPASHFAQVAGKAAAAPVLVTNTAAAAADADLPDDFFEGCGGAGAGAGELPDDFFDGGFAATDVTQVNFAKAPPPPPAASTAATTVNLDSEMEVSRCARILSFAVPLRIVV